MGQRISIFGVEGWEITREDGLARATFLAERGGTGSSLIMPGPDGPRELLYHHGNFWDWSHGRDDLRGGWPFLFPVCARIQADGELGKYYLGDEPYRLPLHGFGHRARWTPLEPGMPDEQVLELFDDDATRARYPFRFRCSLKYRMTERDFSCRMTMKNAGADPMPYYAGFHPYFLTPYPGEGKEEIVVEFSAVEQFTYNDTYTGFLGQEASSCSTLRVGEPGFNESLYRLGSDREVRIRFPGGFTIHIMVEGEEQPDLFPYLQFYTMPEKPFICVEPWMGYPNQLNQPETVHTLAPLTTEHATLRLWTSW
jgi:galactose mutarotase-like enzyme